MIFTLAVKYHGGSVDSQEPSTHGTYEA